MSNSETKKTNSKERIRSISGFPEWLPEYRLVELEWIDSLRRVFESYGFTSIEPRSIEPVEVLLKQGDTDKEIKNNVKQLKKISKTASKPKTKEELRQKLIDMGIEPDF